MFEFEIFEITLLSQQTSNMKKTGILLVIAAFAIAVFTQLNTKKNSNIAEVEEYKFPKKVKAVIDKSCYGCHSKDGKSDDAKDALRWDMMHEYDKKKLVSVMDEIIETIEEKEMPPEKIVKKKPEIKPTDKEYATLLKWAEKEADKILN